MFDIDQFVKIYDTGRPAYYLDKLKGASDSDLKNFLKKVKDHKKSPERHRFHSMSLPQGRITPSVYDDCLIPAIRWQFIVRSRVRKKIFDKIFPLKKWWFGLWYGADLIRDDYIGYRVKYRKRGKNLLEYIGLRMLLIRALKRIRNYIELHHRWIIGTLVAIYGISKAPEIISIVMP